MYLFRFLEILVEVLHTIRTTEVCASNPWTGIVRLRPRACSLLLLLLLLLPYAADEGDGCTKGMNDSASVIECSEVYRKKKAFPFQ